MAPSADPYAALLKELVTPEGLVRYELLEDAPRLRVLEQVVADFSKRALPDDQDERMALWINAYNANVLLNAYRERQMPGFVNVLSVPGFFDKTKVTVAGESLTLNDLENDRVRTLGDARIHAALVCAAMSCPPLRAEPYVAQRLDQQLDDQSTRWVNDSTKNNINDGKASLSAIFNWFGKDFEGKPYGGPVGFIRTFADPKSTLGMQVRQQRRPDIEWKTYDWTLNEASRTRPH